MATFFGYRVLVPCTECGEAIALDGPSRTVQCDACRSQFELPASMWKGALAFRQYVDEFGLTEGRTRGSSLQDGELRMFVRWGPARPACRGCERPLELAHVHPGHDVDVPCACGHATSTFPAPSWLTEVEPAALQLFGAPPAHRPAVPLQVDAAATRPVQFACTVCGAGLGITVETPRVLGCQFCSSDLYLPDVLWRALHPVKKRLPFWVAFR